MPASNVAYIEMVTYISRTLQGAKMTEQEWLTSTDPQQMLHTLTSQGWASNRKLRLFGCSAWRNYFDNEKSASRISARLQAEQAEHHADDPANSPLPDIHVWIFLHEAISVARDAVALLDYPDISPDRLTLVNFLRDIFGNPHLPPPGDSHLNNLYLCEKCGTVNDLWKVWNPACPDCNSDRVRSYRQRDHWLRVNNGQIKHLAEAIYQSRQYSDMPALADALLDVGCPETEPCRACGGTGWDRSKCKVCGNTADDEGYVEHGRGCYVLDSDGGGTEVADDCETCKRSGRTPHPLLTHLRSPGPHVRGCHALDLLTNRS